MKKGVSLITLIITIVVMIILATAVILTFRSTNVISRANEATFKQDVSNYKDVLNQYKADYILENLNSTGSVNMDDMDASGSAMTTYIPGFNVTKYGDHLEIVDGELVLKSGADADYTRWFNQIASAPASTTAPSAPASTTAPSAPAAT